jgi:hypothetical protein
MKNAKGKSVAGEKNTEARLTDLLKFEPKWRAILHECVEEAKRTGNNFAGAWVFWGLKQRGIKAPNNLRKLMGMGVLVKKGTARGGKRAYYAMSNVAAVEKILRSFPA